MEKEHREFLKTNRTLLIKNISDAPAICDYMFEKGAFTEDQKQEVEARNTPNNKVRFILDILPTCGAEAFNTFYECLLATSNTTAAGILEPQLTGSHPVAGMYWAPKHPVCVATPGQNYVPTLQPPQWYGHFSAQWYGHAPQQGYNPPPGQCYTLACIPAQAYMQSDSSLSSRYFEDWNMILKMLQQDLIIYYRELFCKLSISPLIDEDGFASDFVSSYVRPILTIPSHQGQSGQTESIPVTSFHGIFVRNSKPCRKIYISSAAGCGKTSFSKYMALTWCQAHLPVVADNEWFIEEDVNEMRTFAILFFVYLRESHDRDCDIENMIQHKLLCNLANSDRYTKLGLEFLQNLLNNEKCIIILDGLDEWSHPQEKTCIWTNKHIPHSRARSQCTILTTSRPWKLDVVRLKPTEIDLKLELNGLEGDLLKTLIDRVVKQLNELYGKDKSAKDFEWKLKHNKLIALSKIPVLVKQFLTLWYDDKPFGKSQCEIYSNMFAFLFECYFRKRDSHLTIDNRKEEDTISDHQIPLCFQNNMHFTTHMDLLTKLGELALDTLFGANRESSLVLNISVVKNYLSDSDLKMCLEVGILMQEKVLGKISERRSQVSFIHKTYQEFLAALYVAVTPEKWISKAETIKGVCCSIEKILEMSQIFMFLSGLCPEVMSHLCDHLRDTVSADKRTKRYRFSCELSARESSEGRTLRRVQDIMKECLVESWLNDHKNVTHLPVSDFFIGRLRHHLCNTDVTPLWSDELKSLIVNNPICSVFVVGIDNQDTIQDILDCVNVFNLIQKLWLCCVPETFVVQLVSQHKHSLKLEPEKWRHLECVTLETVDISGDILCSLVDSIVQLPKSVRVRLEHCSISLEDIRDWKTYIQAHYLLTVDVDDVSNDYSWNVKLFQFAA